MQFVLFCALVGIAVELCFTAIIKFARAETWNIRWNVKGEVSPWMFLVYGSIGLVYPFIHNFLAARSFPLKFCAHGLWIMTGEVLWGFILDKGLHVRPWHYTSADAMFNGYTRWKYYFFWCIFGFIIERLYITFG